MSKRVFAAALAAATGFCILSIAANAQDSRPWKRNGAPETQAQVQQAWQINQNTITIVSGNPNATYLSIAYDLSAVLDNGNEFRVLPMIGKGGGQNIRDVRYLKGVDLGITQSNLLNYFKRTNEIGNIDGQIVYIAKLFNEELHLIVRAESGITSIEQLGGKKVNFSDIGSGTQLSTRDIFEKIGVKPIEVNMSQGDAFEALKKGEIAASILIAGKPTGSTRTLKASEGFRILPVAYSKPLQNDYLPTTFTHEDYPNLIEPGQRVDSVAVGAVLIAYNWPKGTDRYQRTVKFVEQFFPRLAEFQKAPRHPKWKEANLAATLPGWKRFDAAEEWLQKNLPRVADNERAEFNAFLAATKREAANRPAAFAPDEREQLFEAFLAWKQARDQRR